MSEPLGLSGCSSSGVPTCALQGELQRRHWETRAAATQRRSMCLVQHSILASKRPTGLALGFTLELAEKLKMSGRQNRQDLMILWQLSQQINDIKLNNFFMQFNNHKEGSVYILVLLFLKIFFFFNFYCSVVAFGMALICLFARGKKVQWNYLTSEKC